MDIFISWSGTRSQIVAESLRNWIPNVIQFIDPWISSKDIYAGDRGHIKISNELENSKIGIICLTPENLNKPWILFETGALAKFQETTVIPYLINLKSSDVTEPLSLFQSVEANKSGTMNLINSINNALGNEKLKDSRLEITLKKWWPDLEKILNDLPEYEEDQSPKRSGKKQLNFTDLLQDRVKEKRE